MNTTANPTNLDEVGQNEGWAVTHRRNTRQGTPVFQLQRLETPIPGVPGFQDDRGAWEHLVAQARAGSELHRQVLQRLDRMERAAIEAVCGPW